MRNQLKILKIGKIIKKKLKFENKIKRGDLFSFVTPWCDERTQDNIST